MVTKDKINIFNKHNGDIDSWARSGSKSEKLIMNDSDWYLISELIQDFSLVKMGLTSLSFSDDLNSKFIRNCDSEETIQALKALC